MAIYLAVYVVRAPIIYCLVSFRYSVHRKVSQFFGEYFAKRHAHMSLAHKRTHFIYYANDTPIFYRPPSVADNP